MCSSLSASANAALTLIKLRFQDKLSTRHELASDLLQMAVELAVVRQLWIALYSGRAAFAGVGLAQALTYAMLNTVIVRLFASWLILDVQDKIRDGDIVFDITRPMYYGNILLFNTIGAALAALVTSSLPAFALICVLLHPVLPASPLVWLAFLGSLGLGFLTSFLIDYLLALVGFWTTASGGFFWAKDSMISILGGTYLPLWIYPPFWKEIVSALPFRGIVYTPLAILIGQIGMGEIPLAFALQAGWLVVLALLSQLVYGAAMRRLAVQGG